MEIKNICDTEPDAFNMVAWQNGVVDTNRLMSCSFEWFIPIFVFENYFRYAQI
jgi:hypothetical protein